jgi:hypothetical protein
MELYDDDNFQHDKLAIYIEEICDNEIDMRLYILYDEYEKEYYITGLRKNSSAKQFKFYCKSKSHVYNFIETILHPFSNINIIMYNISNLYDNIDFIDFFTLNDKSENCKELVGYNDINYSKNIKTIIKFIKNLKHVRY